MPHCLFHGRTGLKGSLLGDSVVRHSMGRMWPLLHSPITQSLLESPTPYPPEGSHHPFRLGAGISSAGWTWENRSRFSLRGGIGQAHEGGVNYMLPLICVAVPAGALDLSL